MSVVVNNDKNFIISGSADNTIRIWSLSEDEKIGFKD